VGEREREGVGERKGEREMHALENKRNVGNPKRNTLRRTSIAARVAFVAKSGLIFCVKKATCAMTYELSLSVLS